MRLETKSFIVENLTVRTAILTKNQQTKYLEVKKPKQKFLTKNKGMRKVHERPTNKMSFINVHLNRIEEVNTYNCLL